MSVHWLARSLVSKLTCLTWLGPMVRFCRSKQGRTWRTYQSLHQCLNREPAGSVITSRIVCALSVQWMTPQISLLVLAPSPGPAWSSRPLQRSPQRGAAVDHSVKIKGESAYLEMINRRSICGCGPLNTKSQSYHWFASSNDRDWWPRAWSGTPALACSQKVTSFSFSPLRGW